MKNDELLQAAKAYLEAEDAYSSWVNDPDSHMDTYREPGAGYYRDAEAKSQRAAERFALLAGIKATDWRTLRPAAYDIIAAAPPEKPAPISPGASNRHILPGGPEFKDLKGHPSCYAGWSCPDERHDR